MTTIKPLLLPYLRAIILILVAWVADNASAIGTLQLRTFSPETYKGASQNWCATSDSVGHIYIGNSYGLLMFDGSHWTRTFLPNYSTIRSIRYSYSKEAADDRLYVGGSEEFGYFYSSESDRGLLYKSLISTLPSPRPNFTEVWNILLDDKKVWFQTDNHILIFDGTHTKSIQAPGRISSSALINGKVYAGLEDGRLLTADSNGFKEIATLASPLDDKITGILPLNNNILVATLKRGLFLLSNGTISPLQSDINSFLITNQIFCTAVDGDNYLFGTISGGAVIKNFRTGQSYFLNRKSGLQNNTVLNAYFDSYGNPWLCLDHGLDYALLNSPLKNLLSAIDEPGSGYTSFLKAGQLYIGTNQGLFSLPYPSSSAAPTSSTALPSLNSLVSGQIWSANEIGNDLFIAGDAGLYVRSENSLYKINGLSGSYKVASLNTPGKAIASCYDGFYLLIRDNSGWRSGGRIECKEALSGSFFIDPNNNIWFNHWMKGIYRLHYDENSNSFDAIELYDEAKGIPSTTGNSITFLNGRPLVNNSQGLFTWDSHTDKFTPAKNLNETLSPLPGESIHAFGDSVLAALSNHHLRVANLKQKSEVRDIAISVPSGRLVSGFENLQILSADNILIGNTNGFWLVDLSAPKPLREPKVYLNRIYANADSLVYRAPMNGSVGDVRLPYSLNSLRFEFGTNDYINGDRVKFSTMLENYDDEWTPFNSLSSREFTKLHEGTYTLKIRMQLNEKDSTYCETFFEFRILPPWYRSVWAKIIYCLLGICFLTCVVSLIIRWKRRAEKRITQRKEAEMERLRKEAHAEALRKEAEIATLKSEQLEVDIKHKSGELSTAAMNLIRKNETLTELATGIKNICKSADVAPAVEKQLKALVASIDQNLSNEEVWDNFKDNFDIVYNQFTRRLQEDFPQLTSSDIRMCCYIKMGLSSKDIAPLINISVKSVEMARYRLRKKMNIPGETSLSDFLAKF